MGGPGSGRRVDDPLTATLSTKVYPHEKKAFVDLAQALDMSKTELLRTIIRRVLYEEEKGCCVQQGTEL